MHMCKLKCQGHNGLVTKTWSWNWSFFYFTLVISLAYIVGILSVRGCYDHTVEDIKIVQEDVNKLKNWKTLSDMQFNAKSVNISSPKKDTFWSCCLNLSGPNLQEEHREMLGIYGRQHSDTLKWLLEKQLCYRDSYDGTWRPRLSQSWMKLTNN